MLIAYFLIISILFIIVLKVWDTTYCPKDTHCRCCFSFLSSETKLQGGRGSFWRLTKCGIHSINVRVGCFEKPQSGVNPTVSRPNNEMYYILIVN